MTPQKKMKIMYKTNLNYIRFNRYLKDFLSNGFLESVEDEEGNGCYRITQKGKDLLSILRKANELGYSI